MENNLSPSQATHPELSQDWSSKLLQASAWAEQIPPRVLQELSQYPQIKEYALGEVIAEAGTCEAKQNLQLFIIISGRARLIAPQANGTKVNVTVLQSADLFAVPEVSEFAHQVIAAGSVRVWWLPTDKLTHWQTRYPKLQERMAQQLAHQHKLLFLRLRAGLQALPSSQFKEVAEGTTLENIPATTRFSSLKPGIYWLKEGAVQPSLDAVGELVSVGSRWEPKQSDWLAVKDVQVYYLPSALWESARSSTAVKPITPIPIEVFPGPGQKAPPPNKPKAPVAFPRPNFLRKFRWRYPFAQQQSAADCGATCLRMIGLFWGKRLDINHLREQIGVGRSGASLRSLARAAEALGFQSRPVRASFDRMVTQPYPWVAHWQGDHYVVVYKVTPRQVVIADPALGIRRLKPAEFQKNWTGYALLLEPTPRLQETPESKSSLWRFLGLLWPFRSTIAQILLMTFLLQILGLITPLFTQIILDKVVVQKSQVALNVFSIGLLLFGVWQVGLSAFRQYLLDYFSNRLDLTMISGFINHALTLPLGFFEMRHVGDLITRVQENRKIQTFLTRQALSVWLDTLMVFVYLGLMFYYNAQLTLLVMALIPPFALLTVGSTPFLRRVSREIFNREAAATSTLVETFSGIATVKAAAAEHDLRWLWEDRFTSTLNAVFQGQKLSNGLSAVGGLFNILGSTALLWFGANLVIQEQLTIGQFVAFNMLVGNVIGPVLRFVRLWDEFQEVVVSVERLNDVFEAQPETPRPEQGIQLPFLQGHLGFENVTFRYNKDAETNTLQNLSFEIQPGQVIAIVGRSGSGKSTLAKLIQGLYRPDQGRILIDGYDLAQVSPVSLRRQIGVVPQECFLFSGTIRENIALFQPQYSLEQVIEVAQLAEAHAFIQEFPLGYETKVGERGANLSGGQRQRIAIARALLHNPRFLILDEATSSLDTESERRFQQNLQEVRQGRTMLIIAHRLSTVRDADQILVLDRGVLAEQGTHAELIKRKGLYAYLAQQQLVV
jgi:ATP-binding cassette, subfamily B, bacterial HlyB/CyaB